MIRHKLLERQIRRHLSKVDLSTAQGAAFLSAVSDAYDDFDTDRHSIERSLDLMSRELMQRNAELRDQLTERQLAGQALMKEQAEQAALIKKLEEAHNQLLQSEKLASIGQLAAGVAHEINNPIGFVTSNLNTLGGYVDDLIEVLDAYQTEEGALSDGARQRIAEVCQRIDLPYLRVDAVALLAESADGIRRVRQIVQDLKDFSHVDEALWQRADLHKGIDSTLNIVNNELKYVADVVKDYGVIPEIECLASQLNQVFLNMLVNAAHAMKGDRGVITIRTGLCEVDSVFVEISDNGSGIAPEHVNRIFDPFFTTKPVGKGTGLGLSLSYGIIEKHKGSIRVRSELGVGTTFRVTLPINAPADAVDEPAVTGARAPDTCVS